MVVKVGPEVLQQVSSSLPFLSGNSLLNSGFPETAYFAPRPTAHDEHRAHIKYRGELDHMTLLHISITSALYHWLLQNQNYKKINMHALYFQTGRFEFVNFQAPALVGGHKFAITSSILKWLDVLFTGNWVGVYSISWYMVWGSFHVIVIQKIKVGNTEMTFWSVTTESDLKNETIFIRQLGQYWHCCTEL